MAFENIEDANAFEIQANQRIADLQEQLANQKLSYEEKYNKDITELQNQVNNQSEEIKNYKSEIDRLKIKNYEYYEQISQPLQQSKSSTGKQDEPAQDINFLIKNIF